MLSLFWKKNGYHWALGWTASSGLNKTMLQKRTSQDPMIEHSEISIRWRDGFATLKAQSHSILTCPHFHECIWLQWKSRAEIPSWRWAKMAILSLSPPASPCRNIGLLGGRRRWHIFLSLMKKEIISTGHREKENSFLPAVTIKSSNWCCSIGGAPWVHKRTHLASCRFRGFLPGFRYHKETDPRPSCEDGD